MSRFAMMSNNYTVNMLLGKGRTFSALFLFLLSVYLPFAANTCVEAGGGRGGISAVVGAQF